MKKQSTKMWIGEALRRIQSVKSITILLVVCSFTFQAYSQEVLIGSKTSFYESLKPSLSNARISAAGKAFKSLKVSSKEEWKIVIQTSKKVGNEEHFIGKVDTITNSYVFFTFSNGKVDGKVLIPGQKKAYKYYSKNGDVYSAPEDIHKAMCIDYQKVQAAVSSGAAAPPANSYVYDLQSLPGAQAVVMLDFDGHDATGSWWGPIIAQPANMSETEIEKAWNIISEDFRPFQLNITTDEAVYQAAPTNRRMRCVFTPTTDAAPGWGGVAFIGVFSSVGGDLAPCWAFNLGDGKVAGETGSHEIGHTLNLYHDGRNFSDGTHEEYYYGHANGKWGPIMGASFYPNVSHWSKGEYLYASNLEDDITIIATQNGFGFRADAQGNSIATAAPLIVGSDGSVDATQNYGVIEKRTDLDYFSFTTTGGQATLTVNPAPVYPNLDLIVSIVNSSGTTITSGNPAGLDPVTLTANLAAGTYYLKVDGTGEGDPLTDGYTDYCSIGEYSISGILNSGPQIGITGPSCVIPGQPYVFTVTPEFSTGYNFIWWTTGEATVQKDPLDPKKATITFAPYSTSLVVNVGINYSTSPWYQAFEKTVQIGNCSQRQTIDTDAGTIPSTETSASVKQVRVIDLNGREIITGESDQPELFLKNRNVPCGLYLIQVEDESNPYVIKVVKE